MTNSSSPSGLQFLSVAQAAEQLGISRLKIREAAARGLIPSQRDNENRLRLDLSALDHIDFDKEGNQLNQSALMHALFDEVEELHEDLGARAAEVAALRDIADRQADALEAAADQMEKGAFDRKQLEELLDRALAHLEAPNQNSVDAQLAEVSDRALTALEATGDKLEASLSQTARFDALVARAVDYAAASKEAGATDARAMGATAERAMQMLDVALQEAELSSQTAQKTGQMLERALDTGERLEQQVAMRVQEIETKNATVEKVLEMSERAVALAGSEAPAPRKRSFWQWLTRQ